MACPCLAAKRTALVIGNSNYAASPLANPVNDATDMSLVLKKLGFSVILKTDATKREMVDALREFGRDLTRSDIGLFYFAGPAAAGSPIHSATRRDLAAGCRLL